MNVQWELFLKSFCELIWAVGSIWLQFQRNFLLAVLDRPENRCGSEFLILSGHNIYLSRVGSVRTDSSILILLGLLLSQKY